MNDTANAPGRALHREFVAMLFALAIAEVAIRAADVVNSGLGIRTTAPALAHLFLAGVVIATSWFGWGASSYSLSDIRHVFSKDFIELATDVWLVVVYFFLARGAESVDALAPSASVEGRWIAVMFITYLAWDVLGKWGQGHALRERAWSSLVCTVLALFTWYLLADVRSAGSVVLGDLALLTIVLFFRAAKLHDLSGHSRRTWLGMAALLAGGAALAAAAVAGG